VIVDVPFEPAGSATGNAVALMVKSGGGIATETDRVVTWDSDPLVPVIVTVYVPPSVFVPVEIVRVDATVPVPERITLAGFREVLRPEGVEVAESVTVPVKVKLAIT